MTYKEIEEKGLAYKYVRGSMLYGTNVPGSDLDYGGVFICPKEMLLGLRGKYVEQVSDKKSDIVYYELGRWVELLMKANPNALESLFAPADKVEGPVHPAVQHIIDNKELFLSKDCFNSLNGYAYAQIQKARGLNKKIVNPVTERKDVLDFCYTFDKQGSIPIKEWLARRGLKQQYCGLVSVPNMREAYSVFYDFGNHIVNEGMDQNKFNENMASLDEEYRPFYSRNFGVKPQPVGYKGIVGTDGDSNEVRCSSIPKGVEPICHICYNRDAYTSHCKDYREYKEWEENRNPLRYESNLDKNYDSKNMMHCIRLLHMGKELAEGKGLNVVRTWDRQFLLDIRNHKFEYDCLIGYAEKLKDEMNDLMDKCDLPKHPDYEKVDKLLREAREIAYSGEYVDLHEFNSFAKVLIDHQNSIMQQNEGEMLPSKYISKASYARLVNSMKSWKIHDVSVVRLAEGYHVEALGENDGHISFNVPDRWMDEDNLNRGY